MRRDSSSRRRLRGARAALIGICLIVVIVLAWYGTGAYRERKAVEAEMAVRGQETGKPSEAQLSSDGVNVSLTADQTITAKNDQENSLFADSGDWPDLGETKVEWQGKTYRRSSNVKAILCMGVDRSDELTEYRSLTVEGHAGQADGIFLLAWDSTRGQIRLLMIPRDTMTEITALNDDGSLRGKEVDHLTLAYAYGDGREMSCDNMVESVSNLLLNLPVDYYLAVDIKVINTLNDAVGGVTVTVPTDGMEQADPAFIKGETITLHGSQAERFVRYRNINTANSALTRMGQHKQFIQGFFAAVSEQAKTDSGTVAELFERIQDYMITDMRKEEYLKTAMDVLMGEGIPEDGYYTLPGIGMTTDVYDEYYVNTEQMIPVLLELFFHST